MTAFLVLLSWVASSLFIFSSERAKQHLEVKFAPPISNKLLKISGFILLLLVGGIAIVNLGVLRGLIYVSLWITTFLSCLILFLPMKKWYTVLFILLCSVLIFVYAG